MTEDEIQQEIRDIMSISLSNPGNDRPATDDFYLNSDIEKFDKKIKVDSMSDVVRILMGRTVPQIITEDQILKDFESKFNDYGDNYLYYIRTV